MFEVKAFEVLLKSESFKFLSKQAQLSDATPAATVIHSLYTEQLQLLNVVVLPRADSTFTIPPVFLVSADANTTFHSDTGKHIS